MDSKQVTARLEAERQALALLGHPNIANVLDGMPLTKFAMRPGSASVRAGVMLAPRFAKGEV